MARCCETGRDVCITRANEHAIARRGARCHGDGANHHRSTPSHQQWCGHHARTHACMHARSPPHFLSFLRDDVMCLTVKSEENQTRCAACLTAGMDAWMHTSTHVHMPQRSSHTRTPPPPHTHTHIQTHIHVHRSLHAHHQSRSTATTVHRRSTSASAAAHLHDARTR
jgi:hypothetical protein